jgi:SH3-like domain-containing protein
MNVKLRVLVLACLVMMTGPDKAAAQWGDIFQLGMDMVGDGDEASDASATPEEQERQKQLGIELAKKEKEALFELQKSIFILEKMTEIGSELVTTQQESNYGVFTDSEKFNKLIVSMSNLSEVLKDESQVVHDNKLFLKVKVDKIEKNSARMQSRLDQEKKESQNLMEIVNARSSKVPELMVEKFYPTLRNNAKEVGVKLQASIDTINEIMNATTYKGVFKSLKMASGGLGIYEGISKMSNAGSDPTGSLLGALQLSEGASEFTNAASSTASLLGNFSDTMEEFDKYKGSIEEMSVNLLGHIDASKQLHEEGLVLLEEAYKTKTEDARLKQALGNVPDQEELENPFEEEEIQMAALDGLGESMDTVWEMPIEDVPEGDYKEDLKVQIAEAENISAPVSSAEKKLVPSPPEAVTKEASNKEITNEEEGGIFSSISNWFGGGKEETIEKTETVAKTALAPTSETETDVEAVSVEDASVEAAEAHTVEAEIFFESDDSSDMKLSQNVSDEVVGTAEVKQLESESESLSTAVIDPGHESGAMVPVDEEEYSFELEDDKAMALSQDDSDSAEEVGMAEAAEPEKQEEALSTAVLLPDSDTAIDVKEEQVSKVEKSPADRLQEEIDIVSQAKSPGDSKINDKLAIIKPAKKKDPSIIHEGIQVAKLERETRKSPIQEEHVEGYACVHAKRANLRKGPGTNYQKLAQVKIYTPFERLQKSGKWIKIKDFQDETYWVYKTLITEKYKCGTVAQDNVDFYTKPDFSSFPFYGAPMKAGFSVRILSLDHPNDWVKVVDSANNISWVQKSMLWIR